MTRRRLALVVLAVFMGSMVLVAADAWARVGGGRSSGSRGSRSYSAPARPSPGPASPSQPAAPARSLDSPTAPSRSGWGAGLLGGLGGLLLGGLIGSMLFGGMGSGLFGGLGLLEIALMGGLAWMAMSYFRRRQEPALAGAPGGRVAPGADAWTPDQASRSSAVVDAPAGPAGDLGVGLGHIGQMDAGFDPARLAETASDLFFKVQAAWMARDMGVAGALLTPEMRTTLQLECDRLKALRRVNRLENIAVRTVEVTEAWQESGQDFVTVRFLANLLDYTTDELTGQVVEGSRTEPVKFEEYWTLTRPVGPNPWTLSAIQQPD
jgi:predicted lipid-binding transport protein (Tim44 family)